VWVDPDEIGRCLRGVDTDLVWTQTPVVGEAAAAALGVPYHGAGSALPAGGLVVASSRVFGKGWNGQAYASPTVLEPPANGAAWEQLLARQHRPGQLRDVRVRVLWRDRVHYAAMSSALADARYALETTGVDQRILTCDAVGWSRTVTDCDEPTRSTPPASGADR
jgi:hypothetical protein